MAKRSEPISVRGRSTAAAEWDSLTCRENNNDRYRFILCRVHIGRLLARPQRSDHGRNQVRIKVKAQRELVTAWIAEDDGEWVFSVCKSGFEEIIGQKLKVGTVTLVELTGAVITEPKAE